MVAFNVRTPVGVQEVPFARVRYGEEEDDWGAGEGRDCHDCAVKPGGLHHAGCDVERCPRCHRQLITCDCEKVRLMRAKAVSQVNGGG
jgi:hypothetical protein